MSSTGSFLLETSILCALKEAEGTLRKEEGRQETDNDLNHRTTLVQLLYLEETTGSFKSTQGQTKF